MRSFSFCSKLFCFWTELFLLLVEGILIFGEVILNFVSILNRYLILKRTDLANQLWNRLHIGVRISKTHRWIWKLRNFPNRYSWNFLFCYHFIFVVEFSLRKQIILLKQVRLTTKKKSNLMRAWAKKFWLRFHFDFVTKPFQIYSELVWCWSIGFWKCAVLFLHRLIWFSIRIALILISPRIIFKWCRYLLILT